MEFVSLEQMTDNIDKIVKQMMDYCDVNRNYSYYELKFYAEESRPDWAAALRQKAPRICIAEYLRDRRRECRMKGVPQPTLYESMRRIYNKEPV